MGQVGKSIIREIEVAVASEVLCPVCRVSLYDPDKEELTPCRHLLTLRSDVIWCQYSHPGFGAPDGHGLVEQGAAFRRGANALRRRRAWTMVALTYQGGAHWTWHLTVAWPRDGLSEEAFVLHVEHALSAEARRTESIGRGQVVVTDLAIRVAPLNVHNERALSVAGRWGECDIVCPVCGHVLYACQAGDERFSFCPHTLACKGDGDGPRVARVEDREAEFEDHGLEHHWSSSVGELTPDEAAPVVARPWVRMDIIYEGNPSNWLWKLTMAWPTQGMGGAAFDNSVALALADLHERLDSQYGNEEADFE